MEFRLFKDCMTYNKDALFSVAKKIDEVSECMNRQAEISKRETNKAIERDYIDECLRRCTSAMKEARNRIQRQTQNVMQ